MTAPDHLPNDPSRGWQRLASLRLPDGRNLAFCESGDPGGAPVLLYHGLPGSRLQQHPDATLAASLALRVITVDRPGCGDSTFQPGRRIADWPADVAALLDHLGVEHFALGGWSGGGPYVIATAAAMPGRITRALLVSSLAPLDGTGLLESMDGWFRTVFAMARHTPFVLDAMLPAWRAAIERSPAAFLRVVQAGLGADERAFFRDEGLRSLFLRSILDGAAQGHRGPGHELRLVTRDWGVDPSSLRVPVDIWHGLRDSTVPVAMSQYLASVIPGARLRLIPGEGHFIAFTRWREVLETLASPLPSPSPPDRAGRLT